jgi:EF hand
MNKPMMKTTSKYRLLNTIALSVLTLGAASLPAGAEEVTNAMSTEQTTATYTNDWKSPAAAEFARLDTSGNGLLMRNEASKGKAFNKQTFDQADTNKDGYIDQDEYVYYKTGQSPALASQVDKPIVEDMPAQADLPPVEME